MGAGWRVLLGIALAVLVLGGCGDSDEDGSESRPVVGTFVGALTGSEAYVAVVAGKENVVAYVCDGQRGISELFTGRRSGDAFESRTGRARIGLELSDDEVRGRVALAGAKSGRFSADRARGRAGFYRKVTPRAGREVRLGWVVLADGTQRGAFTQEGTTTAAPLLRTSNTTFTLSGRTQSAVRVSSGGVDATGFGGGFGQFGG